MTTLLIENQVIQLLRKDIYDHLISRKDENDYFDIEILIYPHHL